jgi:hypothetical protein
MGCGGNCKGHDDCVETPVEGIACACASVAGGVFQINDGETIPASVATILTGGEGPSLQVFGIETLPPGSGI